MKTLSYKNPWGYLVAAGIKDIENRTWKLPEKHKGKRVLIHVSAKPVKNFPNPLSVEQWNSLSPDQKILLRSNTLPNSAIIGSVEIVDCVQDHPSIWAEHTVINKYIDGNLESSKFTYNWVLANPVLFAKPILNVKGKLSFWDYPIELCHICGQPTELICRDCDKPYCDNHKAIYDQFNQIDFDCCSECADSKKWGE